MFWVCTIEGNMVKVDCIPHAVIGFGFACDASWITLANLEGTNFGSTKDSFAVVLNVSSLPVGTYIDSVVVTSSGAHNSPQYVVVSVEVAPIPPDLVVSPQILDFEADNLDEEVAPLNLAISCADGSALTYSLSDPPSWVTISGYDGVTPDNILVTAHPGIVGTGTQVANLTVTSDDMSGSPQTVVCRLTVPPWLTQEAPFEQNIHDVVSLDGNMAWAVGFIANADYREGYIYGTVDGGDNWDVRLILPAGPGQGLGFAAIDLAGEELFAVGESGIIYRSSDYGDSWQNIPSGLEDTVVTFNDICFVSPDVGWIVGEYGVVLKTTDGGQTWVQKTSGITEELYGVHFIDAANGWAVSGFKRVIRTSDGGDTWSVHACPFYDSRDIWFTDVNNGWIVGKTSNLGSISFTTDGGLTWSTKDIGLPNTYLQAIQFVDELTGWIVGQSGKVLYTEDAGQTWTEQNSGTEDWLYGVYFLNDRLGWAVGDLGTIRFTTSGGN
ncbi:MAG: YCF48-related protein [Candidatus Zixiibacteriota bacterium]